MNNQEKAEYYLKLAKRIVRIILSPDAALGAMDGALTIPKDLFYLSYSFLNTDYRHQDDTEMLRLFQSIEKGLINRENIKTAIEKVISRFNQSVPEERQNKIYARVVFSPLGRMTTSSYISNKVATHICIPIMEDLHGKLSKFQKVKATATLAAIATTLVSGGMIYRSIYRARALKEECPDIYYKLHPMGLDFLYFLIEPVVEPFVEAQIVLNNYGQSEFIRLLGMVENEMQSEMA